MITPPDITAFVVDTPTPEVSETVQQAAFDAGYVWQFEPCTLPKFTDAPALVFCGLEKVIMYSNNPEQSKREENRIMLTISQALAYFRGLGGNGMLDCTIPEET